MNEYVDLDDLLKRCGVEGNDSGWIPPENEGPKPHGPLLVWYGEKEPEPPPFLIKGMLPQTQTAIVAGLFSAGKTFVAVDLSVCVMTGLPFAGAEVVRTGAVLWLAAEGANEIEIRIKAALREKMGGQDSASPLPFARQAFDVPRLTSPEARTKLLALIDEFRNGLKERNPGVELVLIVIDTLNSAAGFENQNDGAEAMGVMKLLREVSDQTGALVVVVDHFGKMVETGVKGSIDKSGASDAIIAVLSDQDGLGKHSNRRIAQTKLRIGASGAIVPFTLRPVPIDPWGNTTCVVDWAVPDLDEEQPQKSKPEKPAWSGAGKLLKSCIERAMIDHGSEQQPFGQDGPRVRAVHVERARDEFKRSYHAESPEAKLKAFKRALHAAQEKELVTVYEIGASNKDWVWFGGKESDPKDGPDIRTDRTALL